MTHEFTRFSLRQRVEHLAMMILFTALCLTGFPQKYSDAGWARALIGVLGGVEGARLIHRVSGVLFAALVAVHFTVALTYLVQRRTRLMSIVPNRQDFRDAITTLKYYLGFSKEQARFDRFDYRQKFEYWGLVAGGLVMVATGFVLYFPSAVARWLPGELIPASKVAHSNEGLLAFLVVILWHVYNAHVNPDVFPFDRSIFTGRISRERMEHEHPLELARLEADKPKETEGGA